MIRKTIISGRTFQTSLLVAVSILSSCRHEQTTPTKASIPAPFPLVNETILLEPGPNNPANPFDSVGIWHNTILDSVRAFLDTSTGNYSESTAYISRFSKKYLRCTVPYLQDICASVLADTASGFQRVIDESPLTPSVKNYLLQLLHMLKDTRDISSYDDLKKSILKFEFAVAGNKLLPAHDQQIILQASSIARYSSYHWRRIYLAISADQAQAGPLRWFVTVASDVTAGVGGIVGGGTGGLNEVATTAAATSSYWYHFLSAF